MAKKNQQEETAPIIAYKGFDSDWTCRGYKYVVGESYEHKGKVKACEGGFHACENPIHVLRYYRQGKFAIVEQSGQIARHEEDSKERCSCQPGSEARARCACWKPGEPQPIKVYGLLIFHKEQEPLINKHCFGDCGKVSMAGAIHDDQVGGLFVCCEEKCPWLQKESDKPYGTTNSFGRPHEVYLRLLTDTPTITKERA